MRFALTPEQLAFRDAVRELLEKECPPDRVRAGFSRERWGRLAGMGVVGLAAPEASGGLGLDEVPLSLVLEETGRFALPEPLVEAAAVAVPALRDGEGEAARRWLGVVAAGEAVVTVAMEQAPAAPGAEHADLFLLQAGGELHAVPRAAVRLRPRRSLDPTRGLCEVDWEPSPATLVARGPAAVEAAADRGALGTAAQLVGVAQRLVELGAAYARERQQFGRPIGSFQAVKHLLADALLRVEFARPVVWRAAFSAARGLPERGRDVAVAKALASRAAMGACRASLQVHGAIGYTEEHDLHLWLRRGWALAWAWGSPDRHRARVRRALVG